MTPEEFAKDRKTCAEGLKPRACLNSVEIVRVAMSRWKVALDEIEKLSQDVAFYQTQSRLERERNDVFSAIQKADKEKALALQMANDALSTALARVAVLEKALTEQGNRLKSLTDVKGNEG